MKVLKLHHNSPGLQKPQPFEVIKRVCELMNFYHQIMNYNFETKNVQEFQINWCCGEDPFLFKERWDKLFQEFISVEKTHPSKISELYDTMKYDALHNRHFLQKIFSYDPNDKVLLSRLTETCGSTVNSSGLVSEYPINHFGNESTLNSQNQHQLRPTIHRPISIQTLLLGLLAGS